MIWPKRPTDERMSMHLTFEPARLAGFAILAVAAATTLSVGACSSSKDASSSKDEKSPATSSPAAAKHQGSVRGLIASVSGNSVQVTQKTGATTVDISPSTKVIEYVNAQLTDVAAGNCVKVNFKPAPAPGRAGTAVAVQLNPPGSGGNCPQPKAEEAGAPGTVQSVTGTVASVAGDTISVTATDAHGSPSQTDVTVTEQTHYSKGAPATSEAIVQGKCINAWGTKDGGGKVQAQGINLAPAENGECPQFGVKG
ncbi:DUF5666 domain-containing protein [Mycolicibacter sp. MYC123]|uniref:DUF5666 domain-containing protein n=1 Tax=[Mycobacterium] zoologicum TaxID=2872311 RepID=A0ABU5YI39_9MYCO|nr:DUF5666 domain-containing protein [Mycolicibacter sp. MYC123]MEB3049496.1 DUF5666 domain-containing protein [Mycolicibacter sp. MYC123]